MHEYIGIDISKSSLQCYFSSQNEEITLENSAKGLCLLGRRCKAFRKRGIEPILIFEPTGSYSHALRHYCAKEKIACYIVNPRQSANFLKALGERNKSDRVDAKMLSKMYVLAQEGEISTPQIDETHERLREYMSYYKLVQKERVRLNNHLEAARAKGADRFLIQRLQNRVEAVKKEEKLILQKMLQIVQEDATLSKKLAAVMSFKGIGPVAGIFLLHLFLSYPDTNRKQIIALCGLDVVTKESGTSVRKKGRISKKGSRLYRGALFMAVMVAIKHNPHIKAFYERLKEKGKHTTVAQIAVMRKIVLITHALYKNETTYDPQRHEQPWQKKKQAA